MLVKQRIQKSVGMAMIVAFAFASLISSQTFAQSTTNNSTNVLKVSPVRNDIQVPAGTSKTVQVTVSNITDSPISVSAIENDFISGDENGTPSLILDANTYAPTHSLKRFMTPIGDITIPAKQAKTVNVVITVPEGTQAGGYFGAVRFAPSAAGTGGQVNLSGSVASLILLTVPGPTTEKLNLTDFTVQQGNKAGNFFNTNKDVNILIRFENKGNIQEGPFGKISVVNDLFGKKVVSQSDFNTTDPRDQILPDGARKWTVPLTNLGNFGHYTVTATLSYGQSNQSIEAVKTFWIIPVSYIVGAAIALVVLIGLIILVIFLIRGSKRRKLRNRMHGNSRYRR